MLETGFARCTERERESGQSGASLLHACVTDFAASREHTSELKARAIDRLSIAAVSDQSGVEHFSGVHKTVYFFFFRSACCKGAGRYDALLSLVSVAL